MTKSKKERKKTILDGIDKEILRALNIRSPMVSREIARIVGLTASAIGLRLNNLKGLGIIRIAKMSKLRIFERKFGNKKVKISSARSIYWELDLKK